MIDIIVISILGLSIGSFINVVRYRLPRGESIVFPNSYCPSCKRPLNFYENIPCLSWIFLQGKCKTCKQKIPLIYPFVELLFLLIFNLNNYSSFIFSPNYILNLILLSIFSSFIFLLAIIDYENLKVPVRLLNIGLLIGLGVNLTLPFLESGLTFKWLGLYHICSALIGFFFLESIILLLYLLTGKYAFGSGDSRVFALIGAWLGFKYIFISFAISIYLGGLFSIVGLITKKIKRTDKIPFVPFIAIGAYLSIFSGQKFLFPSLINNLM